MLQAVVELIKHPINIVFKQCQRVVDEGVKIKQAACLFLAVVIFCNGKGDFVKITTMVEGFKGFYFITCLP